jgi:SAM-dependent methyltransferase
MTATADVGTDTTRTYRRSSPAGQTSVTSSPVPEPRLPVAEPTPPTPVFENPGFCQCCGNQTVFVAHDAWLRDFYLCRRCGSVPRQRHLQTVLDETMPGWHGLVVHESSPSNDYLARLCADYSSSQYFADVPRGEFRNGVRSEDVEALTFPDESIDVFITQDVLEHVFNPDRAIREIHRVLKPGGAHIFTAPKHRGLDISRRRARLGADGVVEHLLPEEYHGNPIGDNKALVTWDYGYDFEQLMSEWAGAEVQAHHRRDRGRGLDAEFNEVFVIRKPLTYVAPLHWEPPRGRRAALAQIRPALGQIKRSVVELARPHRSAD